MTAGSPYLTTRETCVLLRCSREWLRQHASEIGVIRLGGKVLYRAADVTQWAERHYTRPAVSPAGRTSRPKPIATIGAPRISALTGLPRGAYAAQQRGTAS